jgi:hypothetical protein
MKNKKPTFQAARLQAERKRRRLSVNEVGQMSGVSARHIWRLGALTPVRCATAGGFLPKPEAAPDQDQYLCLPPHRPKRTPSSNEGQVDGESAALALLAFHPHTPTKHLRQPTDNSQSQPCSLLFQAIAIDLAKCLKDPA